jgi:sulfoxide reductase heme-binding subunit YedZ
MALWNDRGGRFSPLKAAVLLGAVLPAAVLAGQYVTGDLGPRRAHVAILTLGLWTVRFLLISLAVTPASRIFQWQRLPLTRRILGVTTACYVLAHLSFYAIDENLRLWFVVSEIVRRIYLTIGFVALTGLVALAITSTDGWMQRLGRRWKRLHKLVYPVTVLALAHYFMQSKADVTEPVMMSGFFVWLMAWRALPMPAQRSLWPLPVLAVGAALATAAIEFAWYGLVTGISPWRVLAANLDIDDGFSPAVWVGLAGIAVAAAAAARRLARWAVPRLQRA